MPLLFEDAAKAKEAVMVSQQKEIKQLYEDWADDILDKAYFYSHKTNASAALSEKYYKELYKQMNEQNNLVGKEIQGIITNNMYTIADSVVASNVNWLKELGFSEEGLNAAFSYIPHDVVQRLVTGQIYQGGWNLSQRIWSDNQQTQKDIYQVMARGLAEQKSVYEIAKDLESYVRPSAKLPWNPVLAMKNTKTGKIEYKRIYKKQVDYNAQRLARTLAQHSYQQSFIAATQKNPFITDYIWHSNGSRVCELCKSRDGVHYKKDELPMDHPNGMCTMEPTVADDMVDQLADWFNSPDGTYPEIDEFAGNFGYNASKSDVKTPFDFVNKYGMSSKSPNAWFNSLTQVQKAEAKMLKEQSGLTWNEWYEKYIHSTGDPNLDFAKKYGTSTKSPNAWFNSLDAATKAEAKLLKEKSGLTWNQWYEKYVYTGSTSKTTTVKAFSSVQDKYLSPYGFSPTNMPKNFDDWSHKISHEQATEILKSMGTNWSDPHPYQQLMKYYNANLTSSNFVNQTVTTSTKAASKLDKAITAFKEGYTEEQFNNMLSSAYGGSKSASNVVEEFLKLNGIKPSDFAKYKDSWGDYDPGKFTTMVHSFYAQPTVSTKTAATVVNATSKVDDAFDAAKWYDAVRKNNLREMNKWTDEWLKTVSSTEKAGVVKYTSNAYHDMNNYLRGFSSSTNYKKEIEACKAALSKASLPQETIVRRGSGYNMLRDLGIGDITPQNKSQFIGAIVTDKGFVSTSPSPSGGFSGSIEYVIKLPKGSQAMYVDSISRFQGEQELLINCGGRYMVEDVEFNSWGDVKKIYMTLKNLQ